MWTPKPRVLGDGPRKMVIEITDPHAAFQQPEEGTPIPVQGDIEYRYLIAGIFLNPLQQPDVALDARDRRRLPRPDQTELLERADTIRVSVEDVKTAHTLPRGGDAPHPDTRVSQKASIFTLPPLPKPFRCAQGKLSPGGREVFCNTLYPDYSRLPKIRAYGANRVKPHNQPHEPRDLWVVLTHGPMSQNPIPLTALPNGPRRRRVGLGRVDI